MLHPPPQPRPTAPTQWKMIEDDIINHYRTPTEPDSDSDSVSSASSSSASSSASSSSASSSSSDADLRKLELDRAATSRALQTLELELTEDGCSGHSPSHRSHSELLAKLLEIEAQIIVHRDKPNLRVYVFTDGQDTDSPGSYCGMGGMHVLMSSLLSRGYRIEWHVVLLDFGMYDWTAAELGEFERLCLSTGGSFAYLEQELNAQEMEAAARQWLASGSPALSDGEGAMVQLEKRCVLCCVSCCVSAVLRVVAAGGTHSLSHLYLFAS